jgi:hypothetical protein
LRGVSGRLDQEAGDPVGEGADPDGMFLGIAAPLKKPPGGGFA